MIGVIESGNSGAVLRALRHIGMESEPWTVATDLANYSALVLPGIGHYGSFMQSIHAPLLRGWIRGGGKTLAICVGMQALYEGSDEAPDVPGLCVLPGRATKLFGRVPRVGWWQVDEFDSEFFYFVHSYSLYVDSVRYQNTLGVQFHLEKSGRAGLKLLAEWARD